MAQGTIVKKADQLVLVGPKNGVTVIPSPTPLTRLHYFDGKFLRARDLELEQKYLRQLVALSNRAGGSGVVHGFDLDLEGNALELGPGLAIDGEGRVLLLPESRGLDVAALLEASRQRYGEALPKPLPFPGGFGCCGAVADEPGTVAEGATFYVIAICHAEALCGEEDVYGKLCAPACSGSTARPYTVEGVVVRALPLDLASALPSSPASPVALTAKHLRSRVAAAYFADERQKVASLISEGGLKSAAWCHGAAADAAGCVPLGLLARAGSVSLFLDTWTVRRERIEAPPRRYWAGVMAMRPWDVFLAQVLQFQCQLACCIAKMPPQSGGEDCGEARELLRQTAEQLAQLIKGAAPPAAGTVSLASGAGAQPAKLDYQRLEEIRGRLADAAVTAAAPAKERRLLHCGIVELPSAGYLPIDTASQLTVNQQVFAMMGESVDLRFCVVRPDYVPHAFEEAQHMERISLLRGYDQPDERPRVDILVPDGKLEVRGGKPPGQGYVLDLGLEGPFLAEVRALIPGGSPDPFQADAAVHGAARGEQNAAGALAFFYAGRTVGENALPGNQGLAVGAPAGGVSAALWLDFEIRRDPFELAVNESALTIAEIVYADANEALILRFQGDLKVEVRAQGAAGPRLTTRLRGSLGMQRFVDGLAAASAVATLNDKVILDRIPGDGFGPANAFVTVRPSLFLDVYNVLGGHRSFAEAGKATVWAGGTPPGVSQFQPLYLGQQRLEAGALEPGHEAHGASTTALGLLGVALGDPDFADSRARRLFPPPQGAANELLVRARLPWVLFHRRREKVCAGDAPPTQVVPRRFRLYRVEAESRDEGSILLQMIRKGMPIDRFAPVFVSTVEFAGGLAAVQSPFEPLRDSWDAATYDGMEIAFGALAGQGAVLEEGETLAHARLASLAGVLAPVTPATDPEYELLGNIHPDLPAHALDGAILYILTMGEGVPVVTDPDVKPEEPAVVANVCQTVYVLNSKITAAELAERTQAIAKTGFDEAKFPDLNGMLLTKVLFKATDATAASNLEEVEKQLRDDLNLDPARLAILTVSKNGSTTKERKLHDKRSQALLGAIGGQAVLPGVVDGGKLPFPFDCPAVSVLIQRG